MPPDRGAGFALPEPPRISFDDFYTDDGRTACQDALVYIGTLVDAFETYLLVGGFPQAIADFRRLGQVSDGFARDLWDVAQGDLRAKGMTQPEQGLRLLERLSASLTGPVVFRSLASELGVTHPAVGDWIGALADAYLVLVLFQESGGVPDVRKQRKVYPIDPLIVRLPSRRSPGAFEPSISQVAEATLAVAIFQRLRGTPSIALGGRADSSSTGPPAGERWTSSSFPVLWRRNRSTSIVRQPAKAGPWCRILAAGSC